MRFSTRARRYVFLLALLCPVCSDGLAQSGGAVGLPAVEGEPVLPPVIVTPPAAQPASPSSNLNTGLGNELSYIRPNPRATQPTLGPYGAYFSGSVPWNSNAIQRDSDLVGPYRQPAWTTQRPYAASRVYVLPAGQAQVEQWVRPTYPRGEKPEYRMLEEFAIGLPGRFQLDLYERWNIEPNANNREEANHEGVMIELRWAMADWGVIPLNPTMYVEWVERGGEQDKANKYEAKLLLADEIWPNLFYASNLILEQEVADERENELGWSNALSTPLIDRVLMAGVECVWSGVNVQGARDTRSNEFLIGPSLQLRPTNRTFLTTVGMFGTTADAPAAQLYFIFGYQFGARGGPSSRYISGPAATRAE